MLIPRVMLAIHNRGKVLGDLKDALIENDWKKEDIFEAFMRTRKWEKYKKREAMNVVSRKAGLRKTRINDIPIRIREENPHYFP
jgi:hypothetical protein